MVVEIILIPKVNSINSHLNSIENVECKAHQCRRWCRKRFSIRIIRFLLLLLEFLLLKLLLMSLLPLCPRLLPVHSALALQLLLLLIFFYFLLALFLVLLAKHS